jgi:signal transduction histidine kinase
LSLRGRLVLIGTTGLAFGLAIGGVILVAVLQFVLQRSLDTSARQTAADLAALVDQGQLADPIPAAGTQIVQVLDADSRIRAASLGADRLVPLLRPRELAAARHGMVVRIDGDRAGLDGPLRVVATSAGAGAESRVVIVAAPARDLEASVHTVRGALLIAYPLLVGVLAVLAWRVVAWTLRPVEALRAGAEEITGAARMRRLPVPDGEDEVHRLAVTLNGMLDRLDASRQRQRAFVGDAAHELRSPIASLRTQLEVSERLGEPAAPADLMSDVDRLHRLVDDLLLLARADEPDLRLGRRAPVELGSVLREVAASYGGARVPVTVLDGQPQWTVGDPDGLRRMVDNLVSNAVRHATSRVELAVVATLAGAGFTVTDDGPGIPPADRERVFERFTRLDDARAREGGVEGAGLGLAIVRELVRLHNGTVTLTDAGPGLRATVVLPPI